MKTGKIEKKGNGSKANDGMGGGTGSNRNPWANGNETEVKKGLGEGSF